MDQTAKRKRRCVTPPQRKRVISRKSAAPIPGRIPLRQFLLSEVMKRSQKLMTGGTPLYMKDRAEVPLKKTTGVNRNMMAPPLAVLERSVNDPARKIAPAARSVRRAGTIRNVNGVVPKNLKTMQCRTSPGEGAVPLVKASIAPALHINSGTKSGRCHNDAV